MFYFLFLGKLRSIKRYLFKNNNNLLTFQYINCTNSFTLNIFDDIQLENGQEAKMMLIAKMCFLNLSFISRIFQRVKKQMYIVKNYIYFDYDTFQCLIMRYKK